MRSWGQSPYDGFSELIRRDTTKVINSYTLNMCNSWYINYTSINLFRMTPVVCSLLFSLSVSTYLSCSLSLLSSLWSYTSEGPNEHTPWAGVDLQSRKRALTRNLDFGIPSLQNLRNKFLLFNQPVYGVLLLQAEWTNTFVKATTVIL